MLYIILIFVFGLCVGSFLNVVIYRLHKGQSLVKPHSYCPHCRHRLFWSDLMPILSFVFLRGRCRYCHKKISWQYPLVEGVTGLLFLLFFLFDGPTVILIFHFMIGAILLLIFVYDLKYLLIPDQFILVGSVCAILSSILLQSPAFPQALLGSVMGGGFFAFIVLISRGRWMGGGDVKLGFLMGLLLGWSSLLLALFLAFVGGALIGLLLILTRKKTFKSAVPFGTFLTVATLVALFFGDNLLAAYLSMLI